MRTRLADLAILTADLQRYAHSANYDAFNRLKRLVANPDLDFNGYSPSPTSNRPLASDSSQAQNQYQSTFAANPSQSRHPQIMPQKTTGPGLRIICHTWCDGWNTDVLLGAPLFKSSPFYSILEPLTPVLECKGWFTSTIQALGFSVQSLSTDSLSPKL